MDLSKFQIFSALTRKMAWLGERQQVLAQNIANADTPNYKPSDLKEIDFGRMARQAAGNLKIKTTHAGHIGTGLVSKSKFESEITRDTYEVSPSGNAVVLEEQLMKVSETAMDFQVMANLYRKHVNMIKTALGRGG